MQLGRTAGPGTRGIARPASVAPHSPRSTRHQRCTSTVYAVATGGRTTRDLLEATLSKQLAPQFNPSVDAVAPRHTHKIVKVPARPATGVPDITCGHEHTPQQVAASIEHQLAVQHQALVTDVEPSLYAAVRKLVPGVQYQARAKMLLAKAPGGDQPKPVRLPGTVALLSGGPADQTAADQCKIAAEHLGCYTFAMAGHSAANMQRLVDSLPALQAADVVVVIAGADSSLPSVVAGLVDAPVVAVPTSTAGAPGFDGLASFAALAGACAPGVTVVGIDAAVSAAVLAARMMRMAASRVQKLAAANEAMAAAVEAAA